MHVILREVKDKCIAYVNICHRSIYCFLRVLSPDDKSFPAHIDRNLLRIFTKRTTFWEKKKKKKNKGKHSARAVLNIYTRSWTRIDSVIFLLFHGNGMKILIFTRRMDRYVESRDVSNQNRNCAGSLVFWGNDHFDKILFSFDESLFYNSKYEHQMWNKRFFVLVSYLVQCARMRSRWDLEISSIRVSSWIGSSNDRVGSGEIAKFVRDANISSVRHNLATRNSN